MIPWLHIIGIGEDGIDGLKPDTRACIAAADVIFGSDRHHKLIGEIKGEKISWPSPFNALVDQLISMKGKQVVVLATGDPLWYSVGNSIARKFATTEIVFHPHVSAFQLVAAKMGWAIQDVDCLTVHGRPIEKITPFLQNNRRLILLTSNGQNIDQISKLLTNKGFGDSQITAVAHADGPQEIVFSGTAKNWTHKVPNLNTLAIDLCANTNTVVYSPYNALPDDAFVHDGTMTKQDVRAITLAALMPMPDALLWDIGCGCGSVAIEWMRMARAARAIGIESRADRRQLAQENALNLGGFDLQIIAGTVPDKLSELDDPDAIFIGGGLSSEVFDLCLNRLKPRGRLVCNAVTLGSETVLLEKHAQHGGTLKRIDISHAVPVGKKMGWKPAMPITQYSLVKK